MTHQKKFTTNAWLIIAGIIVIAGLGSRAIAGKSKSNNPSGYSCSQNTSQTTSPGGSCGAGGGCGCGGGKTTNTTTTTSPTPVDQTATYETVNVGHTAFALNPETINLVAGKNYKLIITPTENGGGCMNTMTIPGLDENVYPVKQGTPITIVINNAKAGTYEVVCGAMGMHQGNIVIQ